VHAGRVSAHCAVGDQHRLVHRDTGWAAVLIHHAFGADSASQVGSAAPLWDFLRFSPQKAPPSSHCSLGASIWAAADDAHCVVGCSDDVRISIEFIVLLFVNNYRVIFL